MNESNPGNLMDNQISLDHSQAMLHETKCSLAILANDKENV